MAEPVDIEQWLLIKAKQFEDQQAPRNLVEGLRTAAGAIVKLRDEVQTWIVHANNAIWSDSEECKMLTADIATLRATNERLHEALWTIKKMTEPKTTTAVTPVHIPSIYSIACYALNRAALAEENKDDR